jgi:sialate O-acetylesterase
MYRKSIIQIIILISFLQVSGVSSAKPELLIDLRGLWKFSIGDHPDWAKPDYDDSHWEEIEVPAPWENQGFHGYDGYAWYRVQFQLDGKTSPDGLFLDLGFIDDVDEVYLNGELIGFTGSFPPDFYTAFNSYRKYHLPAHLIDPNQPNILAVRVYDTVLDGGIIKGKPGIFRLSGKYPPVQFLEGIWEIRDGKVSDHQDSKTRLTMVPGFWKSMKKFKARSFATYEKRFQLSPSLQDQQQLVLILGKVDDFDRVFLNGKLIGFTKDNKPLGFSASWQTLRIYIIPSDILKTEGENQLLVEVEDMGINAGIYEGPIAITTKQDFQKLIKIYD